MASKLARLLFRGLVAFPLAGAVIGVLTIAAYLAKFLVQTPIVGPELVVASLCGFFFGLLFGGIILLPTIDMPLHRVLAFTSIPTLIAAVSFSWMGDSGWLYGTLLSPFGFFAGFTLLMMRRPRQNP